MTTQQQQKPSGAVETTDAPRPPDSSVVTDELDAQGTPQAASAAGADPAGSNGQDSESGEPNSEQQQTSGRSERRSATRKIRRLSKQLEQEREKNSANTRRLTELEDEIAQLRTAQASSPEPKLENFKDPREYAKAYAKWEKDQAAAKQPAATKPAAQQQQPAQQQQQAPDDEGGEPPDTEALTDFYRDGTSRLGDEFLAAQEAAAAGEFAVNRVMGDFLLDSDHGPELFVFLSEDPDLSVEISKLKPREARKRLRELEDQAEDGKLIKGGEAAGANDDQDGGKQAQGQQQKGRRARGPGRTRAPNPPSDAGGTGGGDATGGKSLENMDMEEYAKTRRAQESQQRHH